MAWQIKTWVQEGQLLCSADNKVLGHDKDSVDLPESI